MDLSSSTITDREVMVELGARLSRLRRSRRLSILEVARLAELDRSTVSRAERGDNPTLLTLVRLLRVYGRLQALNDFLPQPELSPMALLEERRGRHSG